MTNCISAMPTFLSHCKAAQLGNMTSGDDHRAADTLLKYGYGGSNTYHIKKINKNVRHHKPTIL